MIETLIELITLSKEEFEALKHLKGNRSFNKKKYNAFRRELEKDPTILRCRDWILIINKEGEIIDGQNHWMAVMEYNKRHKKNPITSMQCTIEDVSGEAAIQRAQDINNGSDKWKDIDYLDSYAERGYVSYIRLKYLRQLDVAKKITLKDTMMICGDFKDNGLMTRFHKGDFNMIREDKDIIPLMGYLGRVKQALKHYGPTTLAVTVFLRCSQVEGIDMARFIEKLKCPADSVYFEKTEDKILANYDKMYNDSLRKTSPKRLDIKELYELVDSYNKIQKHNAKRTPTLKEGKRVYQEDDPDPDNDAAVRISVKDTGEIEKEVLEQQEAKKRGRMAAKQKIEDFKGTLGDKLSHIFSNGPDEDPDGDEPSPV